MTNFIQKKLVIPYNLDYLLNELRGMYRVAHRGPLSGELFFVGLPIYQCPNSLEAYHANALELNPILWKKFHKLYESLRDELGKIFNIEVVYCDYLALPGFHYHEGGLVGKGSWHFDLQFEKVLDIGAINTSMEVLSFSVLLSDDIHSWLDLEFQDLEYLSLRRQINNESDSTLLMVGERWAISHKKHYMTIHNGLLAHRLINLDNFSYSYPRLTLQGFGVKINGKLCLYW